MSQQESRRIHLAIAALAAAAAMTTGSTAAASSTEAPDICTVAECGTNHNETASADEPRSQLAQHPDLIGGGILNHNEVVPLDARAFESTVRG